MLRSSTATSAVKARPGVIQTTQSREDVAEVYCPSFGFDLDVCGTKVFAVGGIFPKMKHV